VLFKVPGVDVVIAIFCDFCQFLAKKLALFSKTNVMIKFLQNKQKFEPKNAKIFCQIFRRQYYYNRNIFSQLSKATQKLHFSNAGHRMPVHRGRRFDSRHLDRLCPGIDSTKLHFGRKLLG
jgi:hypothetical protein